MHPAGSDRRDRERHPRQGPEAEGQVPPLHAIGLWVEGAEKRHHRHVKSFKEGDEVFGMDGFRAGAYAEKVCWAAKAQLTLKPANLTYEKAAAVPYGGLIATYFMRRLKVGAGRRVLIYGASGAIGTSAVQLATHLGAEVTGVCSTANLDLVRSIGAAAVVDYTKEDFTQRAERYDVIFDAVGRRKSAKAMVNSAAALAPGGWRCQWTTRFPGPTRPIWWHSSN